LNVCEYKTLKKNYMLTMGLEPMLFVSEDLLTFVEQRVQITKNIQNKINTSKLIYHVQQYNSFGLKFSRNE